MFITYLISVLGTLLIFVPSLNGPFTVPKTILFIVGMDLLLIYSLIKSLNENTTNKNREIKNSLISNQLSLSIVVMTILMTFSTLFSIDFSSSFFGNFFRLNGLWLHFHLLVLTFFTIKFLQEIKKRDLFLTYLLITSTIISFYGLLQKFVPSLYNYWDTSQLSTRIFSTFGQPNFLGYFLVLVLPLFYYAYKKFPDYRAFTIFGFIINFLALIFTLSRGAWIGFIGSIICVLFIKNWQNHKKLLITGTTVLIVGIIFLSIFGSSLSKNISSPSLRRIVKLVDINSPTFQSRIVMWKGSIKLISAYPFFGIGMDNIQNVMPRFISTDVLQFESSDKIPDRVHNLFFDLTINFGLLGLVGLLFFIYQMGKSLLLILKKTDQSEKLLFETISFGLFSYLLALKVGFQTIGDQIVFWVFIGLIINKLTALNENKVNVKISEFLVEISRFFKDKDTFKIAFKTFSVLLILFLIFSWSLKPLYADFLLKKGLDNYDEATLTQSIELTQNQGMHILYTLEVLRKNIQNEKQISSEALAKFTDKSALLLKECYKSFGQKYLCYLAEARYNDTLGVFTGNQNFYNEAIKNYNESLALNPLFTAGLYEKGLIYLKLNKCQEALNLFKDYKSLELTPKPDIDKYIKICRKNLSISF